jgi:hypothetical protein
MLMALLSFTLFLHPKVKAANPQLISFQGKVVNANGTNVSDGTYNFNFVLFDDPTLGTESDGVHDKWHELNKSVVVTSGVFQTNLGSATALPDFNANPVLYLAVKFNSDAAGYMTPRVQMTSTPYALNSDALGGLGSSSFAQLAANQSFSGNNTFSLTAGKNLQITATAPSTTTLLSVSNSGQASATGGVNGASITFGSSNASGDALQITPSYAGGATDLLTYNAFEVVAFSPTNAAGTDTVNGIKLGNLTDPGATITSNGINIGTGWDTGILASSTIKLSAPAGVNLQITASAASTADLLAITNSGQSSTTSGVNGASIVFGTSNASGDGLKITPTYAGGATDLLTYNAFEISSFTPTNAAGTDTVNGILLGSLTDPGASITSTGVNVGTGWDTGILASSTIKLSAPAGVNLQVAATAVPTSDLVSITNTGQAVTTAVNGLSINYTGGAAAVEAAAARIDLTPGTTSGGTWSGMRIVANGTGAVSGVTEYGVKIEGPATPGAGTETGVYVGTGWDTGLDVQSGGLNLAGYTSAGNPADPAAAATGNLRVYAKKVAGRMLLKTKGPSGQDFALQPSLFNNVTVLFEPNSAAVGTGTGFGTVWQSNGTVSHPVPVTTAPAIANQIHRTRYANVVTTTNQTLGPKVNTTSENQFWRGNAAGLGGFFFNTRFVVDLWPAATVRLFAGLSSSTTAVAISDTVAGDVVGLWHDTTDAATAFSVVTRDNTTTNKAAIALSNAIAAGNAYDFTMYCAPNDSTIYYRLDDLNNGVSYESSTATNLPRNTIFMGPQVEMSNGTANIVSTTTAIGVARIYVESDR